MPLSILGVTLMTGTLGHCWPFDLDGEVVSERRASAGRLLPGLISWSANPGSLAIGTLWRRGAVSPKAVTGMPRCDHLGG